MKSNHTLDFVRTFRHIRTMQSIRISTGPGRHASWPRVRETERLAWDKKSIQKGR
jgi:hypothetical protein